MPEDVRVTELEEGEAGEDDAAMQVAGDIGCGAPQLERSTRRKLELISDNIHSISARVQASNCRKAIQWSRNFRAAAGLGPPLQARSRS